MPINKSCRRMRWNLIDLVKEQVSQAMVNESILLNLKSLGLVSLASADNHCARISQDPGIPDLVRLGQISIVFKMLEGGNRLIALLLTLDLLCHFGKSQATAPG